MTHLTYHTVDVDGFEIFYREAGDRSKPTLLLLHGFPTSSHMFRDLIPLLADRFHLIAPDLPGFGLSALPSRETFTYSFDNLAKVVSRLTEVIGSTVSRSTSSITVRRPDCASPWRTRSG